MVKKRKRSEKAVSTEPKVQDKQEEEADSSDSEVPTVVKKRRAAKAANREASADKKEKDADEPADEKQLSNTFSKLFGGSDQGVGWSSFISGAAAAGSSSSSAPSASSTIQQALTSTSASKSASAAAKVASAVLNKPLPDKATSSSSSRAKAEEPEEPEKKRMSEAEIREREARTLFVGNVPLEWEKKQLRRALRNAVGDKYTGQFTPIWFRAEPLEKKWQGTLRKVGSIKKEYSKDASDAKHAYVVLTSSKDVETVRHAVHGYVAGPRHTLRADGVGASAKLQTFDRKRSVFVGNLSANTTEADLRSIFSPAGQVDAVRIVRDRQAKACKGFAFVRFKDRSPVKAALNMWGIELHGRPIRVMKVTQQDGGDEDGDNSKSQGTNHPAERRMSKKPRHKKGQPSPSQWQWNGPPKKKDRLAGQREQLNSIREAKKAKKMKYTLNAKAKKMKAA